MKVRLANAAELSKNVSADFVPSDNAVEKKKENVFKIFNDGSNPDRLGEKDLILI